MAAEKAMPELPEVETIVRQLRDVVQGKSIKAVKILDKKVVDVRIAALPPSTIQRITRRGKYLLFHLDNNNVLLTHLRMSGHFQYGKEPSRYTAAVFHFQDGTLLTFNEIRRFGRMKAVKEKQLPKILSPLGPEPLECSYTVFKQRLEKKTKSNLKTTLMDQRVLAGLGNIYAQETLYRAGINPQRTVGTLQEGERKKLYHSIQSILRRAIRQGGTTIENYTSLEGAGRFQRFLAVYEKEQCPKKHSVQKMKIGGRGTYWCQKCQK